MNRSVLRWSILSVAVVAGLGIAGTQFIDRADAQEAKPAAAAADQTPTLKSILKDDAVYATVGADKITGKDVRVIANQLPPQLQAAPGDKVLELVVNQLVNDRLVDKAAADMKLTEDKVTQERVAEMTKQVVRERYLEKSLEGKVTDASVKAKYDELVSKTPQTDEIRASHILVTDEAKAKEVMDKLAKGEDFAALAKQYSVDPTKDKGGDLGYFVKSAMVKEFGDAVFAMNKGDVSKTPVKTQFGYHIIKVVDKRKQAPPPFDQVKDRIKAQLNDEQARAILDGLRKQSKVEITLPKK